MAEPRIEKPRVGLFVTCLVNLMRPTVGFAAIKLLEAAGCEVVVPAGQTCCGQPAYNAGSDVDAAALAKQTIAAFKDVDYVVVPSGSCAGMLKLHFPDVLADDAQWAGRAHGFSERVFELVAFLVDVRGLNLSGSQVSAGRVAYHDSCSGLRELGIKQQPRQLLSQIDGVELVELADCEECCGFGGLFSVKFPDISNAMVSKKCGHINASQADLVLAGDLGCLMNIAGKLERSGSAVATRHVAEVLAGDLDEPPICKAG